MKPLEWVDGRLRFLDQTKLPLEECFCETDDVHIVAEAIKRLAIRGAPLIGIAAAYGIALASLSFKDCSTTDTRNRLEAVFILLAATRPTAVNLFWALERQRAILTSWDSNSLEALQQSLLEEALRIHREDEAMCERISSLGAELLSSSCTILTHCNAGILATGGRGTALGIVTKAWELGKLKHVYIDETRPLLQGARLTSWEMNRANIPATLIADNTAAVLMQQKRIDVVVVGADRITMNGDVANKVGTYNVAVLAHHHGIPFIVAAPLSTIDFQLKTGKDIPIEQRDGKELIRIFDRWIAPETVNIYSPAFDVTPHELVTAIVTDQGIVYPPYSISLASMHSSLTSIQ